MGEPSLPAGTSTAKTYSRLAVPTEGTSTGLPNHHLPLILGLLTTTKMAPNVNSDEDDDGWAGTDFSGLNDPGALRLFLAASDYLLKDYDPSNEGYEITWP